MNAHNQSRSLPARPRRARRGPGARPRAGRRNGEGGRTHHPHRREGCTSAGVRPGPLPSLPRGGGGPARPPRAGRLRGRRPASARARSAGPACVEQLLGAGVLLGEDQGPGAGLRGAAARPRRAARPLLGEDGLLGLGVLLGAGTPDGRLMPGARPARPQWPPEAR